VAVGYSEDGEAKAYALDTAEEDYLFGDHFLYLILRIAYWVVILTGLYHWLRLWGSFLRTGWNVNIPALTLRACFLGVICGPCLSNRRERPTILSGARLQVEVVLARISQVNRDK